MHIPSYELRQEMLAIPQLVRFTYPFQDGETRYPTLVIKAHSLLLKYLVQGVPIRLHLFAVNDGAPVYALYIEDDFENGVFLWSVVSSDDEVGAIKELARHGGCSVYLFNEACSNCAWTAAHFDLDGSKIGQIEHWKATNDRDAATYADEVTAILDGIRSGASKNVVQCYPSLTPDWKPLSSHFILNGVRTASLNLLFDNEGKHQEQLAHALLGDLSPRGAYLNTQLHEPSGRKEFTDVVLTHEFGTVLLESKALSIFENRSELPSRAKLAKNVHKSAMRGLDQLRVAARKLREGEPVFDENGNLVELERGQPAHAILLVPELQLLADSNSEWLEHIGRFMERTGGFLHVLDTAQLFRVMQAAVMISNASKRSTPMMAFDYYLIERAKAVAENGSISLDMLLRFES